MTPFDCNPLDTLAAEPLVRRVSPVLVKDGPLDRDALDDVRKAAKRYIAKRGYSQEQVARKLGISTTYVCNFLGGTELPPATEQKIARDLNNWLELDAARTLAGQARRGLYETRVVQLIRKVVEHVCLTRDIGVVTGPAGIGKTLTLTTIGQTLPAAIYLRITTDCVRRSGFLRLLHRAVLGSDEYRPTLTDVIDRLRGSDRLLILDQADDITVEALKCLMDLHDEAQIPIVLAGTHKLLQKLRHDDDLLRGQMSSRVGLRADVLAEFTAPKGGRGSPKDWIDEAGIRAIFEAPGVRLHPRVVRKLKEIALWERGHLRRCERIVRYALLVKAARVNGELVITPEVLNTAITLVDGSDALTIRVEEEPAAAIAETG